MSDDKTKNKVHMVGPCKSWWSGDSRVEPLMGRVSVALERRGINGEARTDIYNMAYEAVYEAIKQYAPTQPEGEDA